MSRKKQLLAYFEKLNGLEKDILVGKAAELLQERNFCIETEDGIDLDIVIEQISEAVEDEVIKCHASRQEVEHALRQNISKTTPVIALVEIEEAVEKYGVPKTVYVDGVDADYYEKLIDGSIPAKSGFEKAIKLASKDAGMSLAMIGLDHPAAETVFRHLVKQKYEENGKRSYLLSRHLTK